MTPPIAVAIVSFNTRALLDACLSSLRADAEAGRAEVWVVDNASTDGSPALVAERHPWARLIAATDNLGFGPAVNRAARETAAAWVAPANADLRFAPDALRALLAAGERHPRAGILAPRLVLPDGTTQPSVQPFPTLGAALLRVSRLRRLGPVARRLPLPSVWRPDEPAAVPWATGAFLLVRRAAWDAVGGFDEGQWMYAEDLDLCWRVRGAGWEVRYEPSAVVHHEESAAAREAFGDGRTERWQRATWAWSARRQGLARTWAVAALSAAEAAARLAALAVLARRGRAEGLETRRRNARGDLRAARLGLRGRRRLGAAR